MICMDLNRSEKGYELALEIVNWIRNSLKALVVEVVEQEALVKKYRPRRPGFRHKELV